MLGVKEDFPDWALFYDAPVFQYQNSISDVANNIEVMRNEENGQATLDLELFEQRKDGLLHGDIQGRGGFIGDEHFRFCGQRNGQHDALLLPSA